jgi:hypothetical protein
LDASELASLVSIVAVVTPSLTPDSDVTKALKSAIAAIRKQVPQADHFFESRGE